MTFIRMAKGFEFTRNVRKEKHSRVDSRFSVILSMREIVCVPTSIFHCTTCPRVAGSLIWARAAARLAGGVAIGLSETLVQQAFPLFGRNAVADYPIISSGFKIEQKVFPPGKNYCKLYTTKYCRVLIFNKPPRMHRCRCSSRCDRSNASSARSCYCCWP